MTAWYAFGRLLDHTIDVKKKKERKRAYFCCEGFEREKRWKMSLMFCFTLDRKMNSEKTATFSSFWRQVQGHFLHPEVISNMDDHVTKLIWAVKEHLIILELLSGVYSGLKQLFSLKWNWNTLWLMAMGGLSASQVKLKVDCWLVCKWPIWFVLVIGRALKLGLVLQKPFSFRL